MRSAAHLSITETSLATAAANQFMTNTAVYTDSTAVLLLWSCVVIQPAAPGLQAVADVIRDRLNAGATLNKRSQGQLSYVCCASPAMRAVPIYLLHWRHECLFVQLILSCCAYFPATTAQAK